MVPVKYFDPFMKVFLQLFGLFSYYFFIFAFRTSYLFLSLAISCTYFCWVVHRATFKAVTFWFLSAKIQRNYSSSSSFYSNYLCRLSFLSLSLSTKIPSFYPIFILLTYFFFCSCRACFSAYILLVFFCRYLIFLFKFS